MARDPNSIAVFPAASVRGGHLWLDDVALYGAENVSVAIAEDGTTRLTLSLPVASADIQSLPTGVYIEPIELRTFGEEPAHA